MDTGASGGDDDRIVTRPPLDLLQHLQHNYNSYRAARAHPARCPHTVLVIGLDPISQQAEWENWNIKTQAGLTFLNAD